MEGGRLFFFLHGDMMSLAAYIIFSGAGFITRANFIVAGGMTRNMIGALALPLNEQEIDVMVSQNAIPSRKYLSRAAPLRPAPLSSSAG